MLAAKLDHVMFAPLSSHFAQLLASSCVTTGTATVAPPVVYPEPEIWFVLTQAVEAPSGELIAVAHKASDQHQLPFKTEFSNLFDEL